MVTKQDLQEFRNYVIRHNCAIVEWKWKLADIWLFLMGAVYMNGGKLLDDFHLPTFRYEGLHMPYIENGNCRCRYMENIEGCSLTSQCNYFYCPFLLWLPDEIPAMRMNL
jgi:hypothetical protein